MHKTDQTLSLDKLRPGERGTIDRIRTSAGGLRRRLLEMGLTKGTVVELVRFAPLGDPLEILLRGYRLSLRRVEAEAVLLVPNENTASPKR